MDIETIILSKVDIVDYIGRFTDLKRFGNQWRGACPIHDGHNETTLCVNGQMGKWYCFAENIGGNVIDFVRFHDHISHIQAVQKLATELNIDLSRDADFKADVDFISHAEGEIETAKRFLNKNIDYLHKRGLNDQTIAEYELGSDSSGNVVIPIFDYLARPVAMAKRFFDKSFKYKNSKNNRMYDKSTLLFGLPQAQKHLGNKLYLAEGYFDAMAGTQMGCPCLAYCGAEISKDQILSIPKVVDKQVEIILVPDHDDAGLKQIERVRDRFRLIPNQVRVLLVPEGCKDLGEYLEKGFDPEALQQHPTKHIDKFVLEYRIKRCTNKEDEYEFAAQYLKTVVNPMIRADCIDWLSDRWGQDAADLKAYFSADTDDIETLSNQVYSMDECVVALAKLYEKGQIKTGYEGIDNCTGEMAKGEVLILGAYSASGKTSAAIDIILNMCVYQHLNVLFFSMEMSKGAVMQWILSKLGKCQIKDVRERFKDPEFVKQVTAKLERNLFIVDTNGLSIDDIEKTVLAVNAKHVFGDRAVDVVVVDYFQYLKGTEDYEGVAYSAKSLKRIAKADSILFVMLSQLNRNTNNFEEPGMNNLKGSGDVEASADYIVLFWRPDQKPGIKLETAQKYQNITRFKIAKARNGFRGPQRFSMKYNPDCSRLENYKEDEEE